MNSLRCLAIQVTLALALPAGLAQDEVPQLAQLVVLAGRMPAGEAPGAVLDTLDIVMTTGANADIQRALQTLPGVQLADEGNALFVRGGDAFETVTIVNGLRFPSATRLNAPAGNFAATLNPFEARRIDFASGGFGARWGDALSAVVDLDTLGPPVGLSTSLGLGLGAASLGLGVPLGDHAGLRANVNRTDLTPVFGLNGSSREYPEPPRGEDTSATVAWAYRPGAELRWFGVQQGLRFALDVEPPAAGRVFRTAHRDRFSTVTWKDRIGDWSAFASLGGGDLRREEGVGAQEFATRTRHRQFAARVTGRAGQRCEVTLGADGARERTHFTKQAPSGPMGPGWQVSEAIAGRRLGVFVEADTLVGERWRAVAGARGDWSSLTSRTTLDPRLSLAWEPRRNLTWSLAGGTYHQVPDPLYFPGEAGRRVLPPMRVHQAIAGLQVGRDERFARLEIYHKAYANLVALDRGYRPVAGGLGRARGLDLMLKSPLSGAVRGRLSYSYVDTQRTDPDSGSMARAPFDATHTVSLLVDRAFGGWIVGGAGRYATGRPFTPIVGGATSDSGAVTPVYGRPFSEQLPPLFRIDLSASRYWRLNAHRSLVVYVALNNALNRANVYAYSYREDFAERRPTPSLFGRTVYFGCTLEFD